MFAENRCGKRFVFWRPGRKFVPFPHTSSLSRRKRRRGYKLVDEGCKIGTKGATRPDSRFPIGTREQTSTRLQNRDEGCNSSRFPIGTRDAELMIRIAIFQVVLSWGITRNKKKIFFFFPKASTGSVSLIIAPKVSQDCLNDQADTADHSL